MGFNVSFNKSFRIKSASKKIDELLNKELVNESHNDVSHRSFSSNNIETNSGPTETLDLSANTKAENNKGLNTSNIERTTRDRLTSPKATGNNNPIANKQAQVSQDASKHWANPGNGAQHTANNMGPTTSMNINNTSKTSDDHSHDWARNIGHTANGPVYATNSNIKTYTYEEKLDNMFSNKDVVTEILSFENECDKAIKALSSDKSDIESKLSHLEQAKDLYSNMYAVEDSLRIEVYKLLDLGVANLTPDVMRKYGWTYTDIKKKSAEELVQIAMKNNKDYLNTINSEAYQDFKNDAIEELKKAGLDESFLSKDALNQKIAENQYCLELINGNIKEIKHQKEIHKYDVLMETEDFKNKYDSIPTTPVDGLKLMGNDKKALEYMTQYDQKYVKMLNYLYENESYAAAKDYFDAIQDEMNQFLGMKNAKERISHLYLANEADIKLIEGSFKELNFNSDAEVKEFLELVNSKITDESVKEKINEFNYNDLENRQASLQAIVDEVNGVAQIRNLLNDDSNAWGGVQTAANIRETFGYGVYDGIYDWGEGFYKIFTDGETTVQDYTSMYYASYLAEHSNFYDDTYQVGQGVGMMLPVTVAGTVLSVYAPAVAPYVTSSMIGVSSFGTTKNEKLLEGYDNGTAVIYAALAAGSDALLETTLGGIENVGINSAMNGVTKTGKEAAKAYVKSMLQEGGEEVVQDLVKSGFIDTIVLGQEFKIEEFGEEAIKTFVNSALVTGVLNASTSPVSNVVVNFEGKRRHLTQTDMMLVIQEVEQNGGNYKEAFEKIVGMKESLSMNAAEIAQAKANQNVQNENSSNVIHMNPAEIAQQNAMRQAEAANRVIEPIDVDLSDANINPVISDSASIKPQPSLDIIEKSNDHGVYLIYAVANNELLEEMYNYINRNPRERYIAKKIENIMNDGQLSHEIEIGDFYKLIETIAYDAHLTAYYGIPSTLDSAFDSYLEDYNNALNNYKKYVDVIEGSELEGGVEYSNLDRTIKHMLNSGKADDIINYIHAAEELKSKSTILYKARDLTNAKDYIISSLEYFADKSMIEEFNNRYETAIQNHSIEEMQNMLNEAQDKILEHWKDSVTDVNNYKLGDKFRFICHSVWTTNFDGDFRTRYVSTSLLTESLLDTYRYGFGFVFNPDSIVGADSKDMNVHNYVDSEEDLLFYSTIKRISSPEKLIEECLKQKEENIKNGNDYKVYNEVVIDGFNPTAIFCITDGTENHPNMRQAKELQEKFPNLKIIELTSESVIQEMQSKNAVSEKLSDDNMSIFRETADESDFAAMKRVYDILTNMKNSNDPVSQTIASNIENIKEGVLSNLYFINNDNIAATKFAAYDRVRMGAGSQFVSETYTSNEIVSHEFGHMLFNVLDYTKPDDYVQIQEMAINSLNSHKAEIESFLHDAVEYRKNLTEKSNADANAWIASHQSEIREMADKLSTSSNIYSFIKIFKQSTQEEIKDLYSKSQFDSNKEAFKEELIEKLIPMIETTERIRIDYQNQLYDHQMQQIDMITGVIDSIYAGNNPYYDYYVENDLRYHPKEYFEANDMRDFDEQFADYTAMRIYGGTYAVAETFLKNVVGNEWFNMMADEYSSLADKLANGGVDAINNNADTIVEAANMEMAESNNRIIDAIRSKIGIKKRFYEVTEEQQIPIRRGQVFDTSKFYGQYNHHFKSDGTNLSQVLEMINPNETAIIEINNTKNINLEDLSSLPDNISIQLVDGVTDANIGKYGVVDDAIANYSKRTYTPQELSTIIKKMESIEEGINPNWTETEKALYLYQYIKENISYDVPKNIEGYGKNNATRDKTFDSLHPLITNLGTCASFSMIYNELLARQGIEVYSMAGKYSSPLSPSEGDHAWNIAKLDGKYYIIDTIWDAQSFGKGINEITAFGSNHIEYYNKGKIDPNQFKGKISSLSQDEILKAFNTINPIDNLKPRNIELNKLNYLFNKISSPAYKVENGPYISEYNELLNNADSKTLELHLDRINEILSQKEELSSILPASYFDKIEELKNGINNKMPKAIAKEEFNNLVKNSEYIEMVDGIPTVTDLKINALAYKPSNSNEYLVHATDFFPANGVIKNNYDGNKHFEHAVEYKGVRKMIDYLSHRHSLHFTINGKVVSNDGGNWDNVKYIVIEPIDSHKQDFVALMPSDAFHMGSLKLGNSAILLVNENEYNNLTPEQLNLYNIIKFRGDSSECVNNIMKMLGVKISDIVTPANHSHSIEIMHEGSCNNRERILQYMYNDRLDGKIPFTKWMITNEILTYIDIFKENVTIHNGYPELLTNFSTVNPAISILSQKYNISEDFLHIVLSSGIEYSNLGEAHFKSEKELYDTFKEFENYTTEEEVVEKLEKEFNFENLRRLYGYYLNFSKYGVPFRQNYAKNMEGKGYNSIYDITTNDLYDITYIEEAKEIMDEISTRTNFDDVALTKDGCKVKSVIGINADLELTKEIVKKVSKTYPKYNISVNGVGIIGISKNIEAINGTDLINKCIEETKIVEEIKDRIKLLHEINMDNGMIEDEKVEYYINKIKLEKLMALKNAGNQSSELDEQIDKLRGKIVEYELSQTEDLSEVVNAIKRVEDLNFLAEQLEDYKNNRDYQFKIYNLDKNLLDYFEPLAKENPNIKFKVEDEEINYTYDELKNLIRNLKNPTMRMARYSFKEALKTPEFAGLFNMHRVDSLLNEVMVFDTYEDFINEMAKRDGVTPDELMKLYKEKGGNVGGVYYNNSNYDKKLLLPPNCKKHELIHEILHGLTNVDGKIGIKAEYEIKDYSAKQPAIHRIKPNAMNEGYTEYLARKISKESFTGEGGYNEIVTKIEKLAKAMEVITGRNDVIAYEYFHNDPSITREAFEKYLGEGGYNKFVEYFTLGSKIDNPFNYRQTIIANFSKLSSKTIEHLQFAFEQERAKMTGESPSTYNVGKVVNTEDIVDYKQAAKDFSEGNIALENLLLNCFENKIETLASCAGHPEKFDPYVAFATNESSYSTIKNIINNLDYSEYCIGYVNNSETENAKSVFGIHKNGHLRGNLEYDPQKSTEMFTHINEIIGNEGTSNMPTPNGMIMAQLIESLEEENNINLNIIELNSEKQRVVKVLNEPDRVVNEYKMEIVFNEDSIDAEDLYDLGFDLGEYSNSYVINTASPNKINTILEWLINRNSKGSE